MFTSSRGRASAFKKEKTRFFSIASTYRPFSPSISNAAAGLMGFVMRGAAESVINAARARPGFREG